MRELGDFPDVRAPGIELFFLNLLYPTVVKDENNIRALGDQFDRDGKLPSENTDVEGKAVARECSHVLNKHHSLAHFVRLGMEYTTNSLYLGMNCDLVQIQLEILALRPTTSHDARKWIVGLIGKRAQVPGLGEHVGSIDVGFQMYGLHHVQTFGSREIVGHSEGTIQLRN